MFEFDKYEGGKHRIAPSSPSTTLETFPEPAKAAFLLWGEHCVECAAPACYSTCDLYVARPDGRCRRFEFGMHANPNFAGGRSPAAEIVFGRWGKLEARGNSYLVDAPTLNFAERAAVTLSRALDGIGKIVAPLARDARWKYAAVAVLERLNMALRKRAANGAPDGFLLDVYNPGERPVPMLVAMGVDRTKLPADIGPDAVPRPFAKRLVLAPGRHRELIPYAEFRDIIESRLPFNLTVVPNQAEGAHLVFLALDLVRFDAADRPAPVAGPPPATAGDTMPNAKCLVFDLDNTLWNGVLLETDTVKLRPDIEALLRRLDERGILFSIASKNTHDHAIEKLRQLGVEEYFLFPRINWGPKSESLKLIARDLDIGIDTFMFVDDNPFELDEVHKALPMVECVPVDRLDALPDHPRLQGSTSAEARTRRKMYREAMVRADEQTVFGEDYLGFLRSCDIRLTIRPDEPADFERVCELIQRTNQLNFSGRKYKRHEVDEVLHDASLERHVLICEDKYGSYGTVGFCLVRRGATTVSVEDFMLSCRVQGKFVEAALFEYLCDRHPGGTPELRVNFRRTPRNTPAQQVLAKLGFDLSTDGYTTRDPALPKLKLDFITVIAPANVMALDAALERP